MSERLWFAVVGGALAVGGTAISRQAEAVPTYMSTKIYYSDATKTVEVGAKVLIGCTPPNNYMLWGVTSNYYSIELDPCTP